MSIGSFKLPISQAASSGEENLEPTPYVRPVDWLDIDSLVTVGQQKFVGLVAIFEDSNFFAVRGYAAYTVDWGDGTVTNYASSVVAYHQYDWNYAGFVGTETTEGFRQAIITITPQAGQNLTTLNFNENHNQSGLQANSSNGLLDVKVSGALITFMTFNNKNRFLQRYNFVGTNSITSVNGMFQNCHNLREVNVNTSSCTNFTSMFFQCYAIESVPNLDTSLGTAFGSMFYYCENLKSIPNFDFSSGVNFQQCFNFCVSIVKFPDMNCIAGTNFTSMFANCYSMIRNPNMITSAVLTKSFQNIFANCGSMLEFVDFNTQQATSYATMFQNCYSLKTLPGTINLSGTVPIVTNNMFQNCYSIQQAPNLDLSKSTNVGTMFANCQNMESVPAYTILVATSMTSMFSSCFSLISVGSFIFGATNMKGFNSTFSSCASLTETPNWNLSQATDVTNMFNGCVSLRKTQNYNLALVTANPTTMYGTCANLIVGATTGLTRTISYIGCKLSRQALIDIFNGLGTAAGAQTITITNNWGAALLTAPERAIATGKGWTIVG